MSAPATTSAQVRSLVTHAAWRMLAPRQFQQRFYDRRSAYMPPPPPPPVATAVTMGFIPWLLQTIKLVLGAVALLSLSMASYGILYQLAMPARYAAVPLYFDYAPDRGGNNYSPSATIDLWAHPHYVAWEAVHEAVAPPVRTTTRLLTARQAYYLEVALLLPESPASTGLLGVRTELATSLSCVIQSSSNDTSGTYFTTNDTHPTSTNATQSTLLAHSTRWTPLPHVSRWIRTTFQIVCLPAYWVGALAEVQTVVVVPFRHFVEARHWPLRHVTVQLHRPADAPVVHVIRGEVRIGKELNALQELLREWYYTGCCVGTLLFACVYLLVGTVLMERFGRLDEEPDCELDLDDLDMGMGDDVHNENNSNGGLSNQRPEHHTDGAANPPRQVGEDDSEPHFEDWQDYTPPPINTRGGSFPNRASSHPFAEPPDSEWEDIN